MDSRLPGQNNKPPSSWLHWKWSAWFLAPYMYVGMYACMYVYLHACRQACTCVYIYIWIVGGREGDTDRWPMELLIKLRANSCQRGEDTYCQSKDQIYIVQNMFALSTCNLSKVCMNLLKLCSHPSQTFWQVQQWFLCQMLGILYKSIVLGPHEVHPLVFNQCYVSLQTETGDLMTNCEKC